MKPELAGMKVEPKVEAKSPRRDGPNAGHHETTGEKPESLSEMDLATVRQLYGEVQNWTRHYEQLIVNANVLIVSGSLIFVGLAFGERVSRTESVALLVAPAFMAVAGIAITRMLFNLYAHCIERLIRLEAVLGCNDGERMAAIDGKGPLVPAQLHALPVRLPTSVRLFIGLHLFLLASYLVLAIFKIAVRN